MVRIPRITTHWRDRMKFDIFKHVTDQIVEALKAGSVPWQKPWTSGPTFPRNYFSKREYRGINVLILMMEQMRHGYPTAHWIGMRQANELGGFVRKGERATYIYFAERRTRMVEDADTGEDKLEARFIYRAHRVWNLAQIDGIKVPKEKEKPFKPNKVADGVLKKSGAVIEHGGDRACFVPSQDLIRMPEKRQFKSETDYYRVALHELTHWTGHESRLNRNFSLVLTDTSAYAREELVAEIGSAFLCAHCRIPSDTLQHAAYLKHYLSVLENDTRFIFKAATQAQKAFDLLLGIEREEQAEDQQRMAA
jgi:antirestriction protein ArdC